MTRLRHLWLAIVGERFAPPHEHTYHCTPTNCDISVAEYQAMRENETFEELRGAIIPLAHMHIPGAPPDYVLCARTDGVHGYGQRYMLTMAHATRAAMLLERLG
jgi:hypothetical protein